MMEIDGCRGLVNKLTAWHRNFKPLLHSTKLCRLITMLHWLM